MNKISLILILCFFQLCIGQNIIKKETVVTYKGLNKFGKIEKGELLYKSTSFYDKRGNIISSSSKSEDEYEPYLNTKETTKFNTINHPTERNLYNLDGSLIQKWIFKYDKNGNEIENFLYKSDGSLNTKWTLKYNDNGQKIEECRFDSDGIQKNVFYYDSKGNIELFKGYNNDNLFSYSQNTYTYDYKGNVIKIETYNADNSLTYTVSNKYDLRGNLIEKESNSSDDNRVFKDTYSQFNKLGKWTKNISYTNDEINTITIKIFEYYK